MKRRAFITGVAGQDGSYLVDLLLTLGYDVYGLIRHSTQQSSMKNIEHLMSEQGFKLESGDILDQTYITKLFKLIKPHEIYNLAAQSHVGKSFEMPAATNLVTGHAVICMLEAIRDSGFNSKFYQASTSEMFGNSTDAVLTETTPFAPVSPYGCAKLFAHHAVRVYREAYNMFACAGVMLNHESPRRGPEFVTQKIAQGVARIKRDGVGVIKLGNIDAKRDWGHARDYVKGMHAMLQASVPDEFVFATGELHSVREFIERAFDVVGLDSAQHVVIDPTLYRPIDVHTLCGSSAKAAIKLGWRVETQFSCLVEEMVVAAVTGCRR